VRLQLFPALASADLANLDDLSRRRWTHILRPSTTPMRAQSAIDRFTGNAYNLVVDE
jgi:hypothetical protein